MKKIVGFCHMAGTSSKTGRPYSGYRVYFEEEFPDNVDASHSGVMCDSIFLADDLLNGQLPYIGGVLELSYSRGYNGRAYLQRVEIA